VRVRPERWLVDGMNVIGSRPDGWWRDRPGAVRRLTESLSRWASVNGEEVTVVFDGRPVPDLADTVAVTFAPRRGPNAADDEIVRIVSTHEAPATLRVVTSDAALAARVRALGATVLGAGEFRAALDG
jgi:predicted RNA-binding protein with PIN domain